MVIVGTENWGLPKAGVIGDYKWAWRYLDAIYVLDADCNMAETIAGYIARSGRKIPTWTAAQVNALVSQYRASRGLPVSIEPRLREIGYCAMGLNTGLKTPERIEPQEQQATAGRSNLGVALLVGLALCVALT